MSTIGPTCSEIEGVAAPELRTFPVRRLRWLVGLLAAEIVVLSVRFDTASLRSIDALWAETLGDLSLVGQLAISLAIALLIFGGERLRQGLSLLASQIETRPFPWRPLIGHLAAVVAFYQLTVVVLEGHIATRANPGAWVAAWAIAGLLSFGSWVAAVAPVSLWRGKGFSFARMAVISSLAIAVLFFGQLAQLLWRPLAEGTFWIVARVLGLFYETVIVRPADLQIGTSAFEVQIAPSCSGCEGIGLVAVFIGAFLWWFREKLKFPQAFLLLLIGFVAVWLANALRIAALIAIGSSISPAVAAGGFHSQAGWLAFNAITLGLVAIAWNSAFFSKASAVSVSSTTRSEYPAAPYLVPLLVLVATVMVTQASSSGAFDWLYPVRVLAAAGALGYFFGVYRRQRILTWQWSWQAMAMGAAVFVIWIALEPLAGVEESVGAEQAAGLAGLSTTMAIVWLVFRAIGSVITVPLCEELAFRGFLTRRLMAEDFESVPIGRFSWFSLIVSSALFGLLHGRWLAGTLGGMCFAIALYRRGRLTDAVLAHATANGLVTGYVLATGNWAAWS